MAWEVWWALVLGFLISAIVQAWVPRAVLWSGGIALAGVIAFIFADLIVLPIILIYRRYYGARFTLRIVALMLVTMVAVALAVDGLFSAAGLIPSARPTRADIFTGVTVDYRLFTNVVGIATFVILFALSTRFGARVGHPSAHDLEAHRA